MKTLKFFPTLVLVFSILASVLFGCRDEGLSPIVEEEVTEEEPEPEPEVVRPDGEALQAKYSEFLGKALQEYEIDGTEGGTIRGEKGTEVKIFPGTLVKADGTPISGNVKIQLIEIFDRASMLLGNKPTQGRQPDGAIATLISGGEFFINAQKDGEQLFLKEGQKIQLKVGTERNDEDMRLFRNEDPDCLDTDCNVVWEEEEKGMLEIGEGGANGGTPLVYYGFANNFGWTNIDKWYNDPRPKTSIFVDVPEGYDQTNCSVFISYDGEPTALARFDMYNEQTELFTEHYGLIPIGLEVHFIILSVVDGQYYYAIQAGIIEEDHIETMGALAPTTEAELIQMIEDLP